ncbi:MAG: DegV family protein [Chloroflexi bacterium]|nr:DegV family protein [Chloroflexota bacterium]
MQIVSDSGLDLSPGQLEGLNIHIVPLSVTIDGKSYRSGIDLQSEEFYQLLEATDNFPNTSQPSAGDFAALYQKLAEDDPEILSIHISSGLSGTIQSAQTGAKLVPQARITFFDTKTLSCPMGWQVEAAARGAKAGWTLDQILAAVERIRTITDGMFTLSTLKYLIHGGRISHLKGLIASLLSIKPVIGVEKTGGTYVSLGQEITLKRALHKIVAVIEGQYPPGTPMRFQLLHGNNPAAVEILHDRLLELFPCTFLPTTAVGPALGAHTGPGLVGLALAPAAAFPNIP